MTCTRAALASIGGPANLVLTTGVPEARIVDREPAAVGAASDAKPAPATPPAAPASVAPAAAERDAERLARRRELERKRAAAEFDVFLCHNTSDKPAVKRIAEHLEERGILTWLDEWELPPGQPWQPLLEKQIANIKSAAVFVGAAGVGPWQEQEIYGFLREFVSRKSPCDPRHAGGRAREAGAAHLPSSDDVGRLSSGRPGSVLASGVGHHRSAAARLKRSGGSVGRVGWMGRVGRVGHAIRVSRMSRFGRAGLVGWWVL